MKQKLLKQKTNKTTKPKKKPAKVRRPEEFNRWHVMMSPDAHRFFPGVDQLRERLIYTLLEWARDPEHLDTTEFLIQHYIPPRTMNDWVHRYPDVKDAWEQARLMLASHRRVGSMKRKLDPKSCFRDIHVYDPAELRIDEYQAKLAKNSAPEEKATVINVIDSKPEVQSLEDLKKDQDAGN